MLKNKSCPLYKATLPVYFVGILSTLVDNEMNGWSNLSQENQLNTSSSLQFKANNSPNTKMNEMTLTAVDKRLDYMNNYLKNVFFTLSLSQSNLDGLIAIYELMKYNLTTLLTITLNHFKSFSQKN